MTKPQAFALSDLSGPNLNAKILVTNKALQPAIEHIKDRFAIQYLEDTQGELPDVTGLLSSGWDIVDKPLLDRLPNLEVISHLANGLDAIDMDVTESRNIALHNTPNAVVNDTADLALAFVLNLSRRVLFNHRFVEDGKWGKMPYPLGQTLTGKTVGIVGLGKIGKAIAKRCQAFDMQIHYWGRNDQKLNGYEFHADLTQLARRVDYLIISCAGNDQTRGIINQDVLAELKPTACVINVARGFVVDQAALIQALDDKRIAGAGLDVFEQEPNVPDALLHRDNLMLQPHAGSATEETRAYMFWQVANHLVNYFQHKDKS